MLPNLGIWEILAIALVVVLLFGARKLPEIGRGLGEGIRSFRNALRSDDADGGKEGRGGGPSGGGTP